MQQTGLRKVMTEAAPGRSRRPVLRSCARSVTAATLAVTLLWAAPAGAAGPMQSAITATNAVTSGRNSAEDGGTPPATPPDDELAPISDGEIAGYGCLASGAAATALMWLAGTNQMIMVVAGGTLGPTNLAGIVVAVTGTVFASVCAVGALATPAVLRMWDIYYRGKHVKAEVTTASAP